MEVATTASPRTTIGIALGEAVEVRELLHVSVARHSPDLLRELLDTYHLDPNTPSPSGIRPLLLGTRAHET